VEVKIGVQYAARELTIETDETIEAVEKLVAEAVSSGGVLALVDHKGKKTIVPGEKITYVEIGTGTPGRVGFRG
jgi:ABC-type hemin transport system substrate-binding protein